MIFLPWPATQDELWVNTKRTIFTQDLMKTLWDTRQYCFGMMIMIDWNTPKGKHHCQTLCSLGPSQTSWQLQQGHCALEGGRVPGICTASTEAAVCARVLGVPSREQLVSLSTKYVPGTVPIACTGFNPFTPHTQTNKADYHIVPSSQHEVFDFLLNNQVS